MMSSSSNLDRPISDPIRSPPSKSHGGAARLLSFLLQALVMAVALTLFFLFAGVAALVLLHLFVAGRALRRRRSLLLFQDHHHHHQDAYGLFQENHQEQYGLLDSATVDIKSLPSFQFSSAVTSSSECVVCLEGYREGERCRKLAACGHVFHRDCVDRWLVRSPACPICRRGVSTAASG